MKYVVCMLIFVGLLAVTASAQGDTFKEYIKEPSTRFNFAATVADVIVSAATVNDKGVREGNPLVLTDGKIDWLKVGIAKAAVLVVPFLVYNHNAKMGRKVSYICAVTQTGAAVVGLTVRF